MCASISFSLGLTKMKRATTIYRTNAIMFVHTLHQLLTKGTRFNFKFTYWGQHMSKMQLGGWHTNCPTSATTSSSSGVLLLFVVTVRRPPVEEGAGAVGVVRALKCRLPPHRYTTCHELLIATTYQEPPICTGRTRTERGVGGGGRTTPYGEIAFSLQKKIIAPFTVETLKQG